MERSISGSAYAAYPTNERHVIIMIGARYRGGVLRWSAPGATRGGSRDARRGSATGRGMRSTVGMPNGSNRGAVPDERAKAAAPPVPGPRRVLPTRYGPAAGPAPGPGLSGQIRLRGSV